LLRLLLRNSRLLGLVGVAGVSTADWVDCHKALYRLGALQT
jgi:hypothetical protein